MLKRILRIFQTPQVTEEALPQECKNGLDSSGRTTLIEEYRICQENASRLEANIWQTAALLGIGSIVGLTSLAKLTTPNAKCYWLVAVAASALAVNATTAWWRFARRWWSIQHVSYDRMSEIESQIGFKRVSMVRHRDRVAQKHRLYLKKCGTRRQKLSNVTRSFTSCVEPEVSKQCNIADYEYRGNQPVAWLLVLTIIASWVIYALYTACEAKMLVWAIFIFVFLAIVEVIFLGKP
jgi:hypothetical protein